MGRAQLDDRWRHRTVDGGLAALGVLASAATVVLLAEDTPVSYAAASPWFAAATLTAALGLVAAGLVTMGRTSGSRTAGSIAVLVAVAWLAPVWVGWWAGPSLVRSVAMVVAPFLLPLLVHLAVVAGGRSRSALGSALVRLGYCVAAAAVVIQAMFRHPIQDLHCWSNCTVNVFLWRPLPDLMRITDSIWLWSAVGLVLATVGLGAWRLLWATDASRAQAAPVLLPAVLAVLAEGGYTALLLVDRAEDPSDPRFAASYLIRAATLIVLALGLLWKVESDRRRRHSIERLVEALHLDADAEVDMVPTTLARTLGDPEIQIAYWLDGPSQYVDSSGRRVDLADGRVTHIERGGRRVAALRHHRVVGDDWQVPELGAAARLAIDNERLRAEVLAQLDALRASRSRIVAAADEKRSQVERDLHDGTQQSLIGLLFELRLALADEQRHGDPDCCTRLTHAVAEAERCVAELRELAHGIFPAVLDESGLATALWTLTDQAPIPVEMGELPAARLPPAVERTAYAVVRGVIDEAARYGSTGLCLAVHHDERALVVEVNGAPEHDYVHLADRVGAAGGELVRAGQRVQAVIPCAS